MTVSEKLKHCVGCSNDFYNGNNDLDIKQCWSLASAKLVPRLRIPVSMCPPYTMSPKKVFNCRHERGYVLVDPENITKDGYWR